VLAARSAASRRQRWYAHAVALARRQRLRVVNAFKNS
jgi:hypothetical protein